MIKYSLNKLPMFAKKFLPTKNIFILTVAGVLFLAPFYSSAATYQPRTNQELIAYLYGRIIQLNEIKQMIDSGKSWSDVSKLEVNYVLVETHKATEIEETTAVLRGEVQLFGDATASVWFEYGEDENFLDQKTSRKSVRSAYDRAVRIKIDDLEDDERYYFRIVSLNKDKTISYGEVYQFRTD